MASAEYMNQYNAANREKVRAINRKSARKFRENNRILCNERIRKWGQDNPDKRNVQTAKRRAQKLHAMPNWLTKQQKEEISLMYKIAIETDRHVDHIIPLLGKTVCGLHVPWNLQLLLPRENLVKSNSLN